MQKSRKALRLYSNMNQLSELDSAELADVQVHEWKAINADLLKQLTVAVEQPNGRFLLTEVLAVRDRFLAEYRLIETSLRRKQSDLLASAENGDFVKSAILANELVALKARNQACLAANHELQELVGKSHVASSAAARRELDADNIDAQADFQPGRGERLAKIIPLRGRAS